MKKFEDVYKEVRSADTLTLGDRNSNGNLILTDKTGLPTVEIKGEYGVLYLGGHNSRTRAKEDGDLIVRGKGGKEVIKLDGDHARITVGGPNTAGTICVKNKNDIDTVKVIGESGDIEFLNADFAEDFDIAVAQIKKVARGMVMVLDANGKLVPSTQAHDKKVVGIVAGAGDYKPGIVMDKTGGENRMPIALMGKVSCWVDADLAPVEVGDMLTTSGKEGFAMKATDPFKSFGAVIGKALTSLESGTGMVTVLVNLQ